MSIAHPKAKQIRLPFDVPRPQRGTAPAARVCGICRKAESRYTCPRCNVAYCSLDCFRAQAHAQCSEPFYHETIKDSIAGDRASAEEKRAMMEMLRRFEEGADDLGPDDDDDDGDEAIELAAALDGVDLDSVDTNELFRLLPAAHRSAFLTALQDPDSAAARELLAQAGQDAADVATLLADAEAAPAVLPWWEREVDAGGYAEDPTPIGRDVLEGIALPPGVGDKLVYNVLAVTLAYLHTLLSLRLPSLARQSAANSSAHDVSAALAPLVPFLFDQKSTTRHASAREAYESTWASIGAVSDDGQLPPSVLVRLLHMALPLFRPKITLDPPRAALVLGDLYGLGWREGTRRKLAFYARAVEQVRREVWVAVCDEIESEVKRLEQEVGQGSDGGFENEDERVQREEAKLLL
ncbi:Zinc finger HIT domain-containing protein 2 [Cryptotrichosporon argae]